MRGLVKLPTGDTSSGASTGKADFAFDGVVSKEVNERVEASGYAGFIVRGSPDEVDTTNGFRWGFGAGFPTRKPLRFTAEIEGEHYSNDTLVTKQVLTAEDGSILPVGFISDVRSPANLHLGFTWQGANGVFAGAGWTWRMTMDAGPFPEPYTNGAGDKMDLVVRVLETLALRLARSGCQCQRECPSTRDHFRLDFFIHVPGSKWVKRWEACAR